MDTIRVLVVDDAAFMRDMVKKALRPVFPAFKLEEAAHGKQAVQMLERQPYDLILCDWEMPGMSGPEVLEWVRGNEATADTPFVMVTSRGDKDHVMRAIELKANNYIVKPYTTEKLVGVVTKVLAKARGVSEDDLMRAGGRYSKEAVRGGFGRSGAVPVAATLGSAHEAAPADEPVRTSSVKTRGKVLVQMRFSSDTVPCLLVEIGHDWMKGVIRRDDKLPGILNPVVVDLQHDGEVARLNGYIHTLQARDESRETEFVNITVGLVDQDDPDKMSLLDRYMASLV